MKIAVLTTVWQRPRLTELVMRRWAAFVCPGAEVCEVVAVCSTDEDAEVCKPFATVIRHPNDPKRLNDKWLAGVKHIQTTDADAVLITGSDDVLSTGYVAACASALEDGHHAVAASSLYFYSGVKREMLHCQCRRVGGGRMLSRALLDEMDWQPWEPGKRHCDASLDRMIETANQARKREGKTRWEQHYIPGEVLLAVKGPDSESMWGFAQARKMQHAEVDAEAVLHEHFPGVATDILNYRGG